MPEAAIWVEQSSLDQPADGRAVKPTEILTTLFERQAADEIAMTSEPLFPRGRFALGVAAPRLLFLFLLRH